MKQSKQRKLELNDKLGEVSLIIFAISLAQYISGGTILIWGSFLFLMLSLLRDFYLRKIK